MPVDRENLLFDAFRREATRDSLANLLTFHQDRAYNICFQVLHHPEDAEDVAQGVLLEAIRWLPTITDPRQFKVWLYRVALHASLKHKQARSRRVELARKLAAQSQVGGASMESEERAALMEAIGGLDDRTRCLILEYYFDKSTLEEIAERQGISVAAVWKRLEHAREGIKRVLVGAGFLITGSGLAQGMEALTPVTAPADLAAKALVSKAAIAAAGGALVGAKSAFTAAVALLVAALLVYVGIQLTSDSVSPDKTDEVGARDSATLPAVDSPRVSSSPVESESIVKPYRESRIRLLDLLSRRYPEFRNRFWGARKSGFGASELLADKEVLELVEWIANHNDPAMVQDLVDIFRTSKSDVGTFALVVLAAGRHPDLEPFFTELLASKAGPGERILAAWGLSQIASASALDRIAETIREGLATGPNTFNMSFMSALGRTGGPGLDRLLSLAEEEIRLGRLTVESLRPMTASLIFAFDTRIADRLRELAESHHSPAIRLLAALPLSVSPEHQAWLFNRMAGDPDPVVRERIKDRLCLRALIGGKEGWAPDVKSRLPELLQSAFFTAPGARLRAGLRLDMEAYSTQAREFVAAGNREERSAILGELASIGSAGSTRLLEELALRPDFRNDEAHMLARSGTLTDARLADKLFGLLLTERYYEKPVRAGDLIHALAKFPEADRASHAERLKREYPAASPSARLAILEGLWRFGTAGEERLLKTARSAGDGVEQLAAWNALASTARFEGVVAEAKAFLKRDPNTFGEPPEKWRPYLAGHYLNLVAQTYLVAGSPEDIPMLERMAATPRVPFSSGDELIALFRIAAQTAIDAIRLRSAN